MLEKFNSIKETSKEFTDKSKLEEKILEWKGNDDWGKPQIEIESSEESSDKSKSEEKIFEWQGNDDWGKLHSKLESEKISLTPLSEDTKVVLEEKRYPEAIIDKIKTEEEAKIYLDADLKVEMINGKPALINTNIDLQQKDIMGRTNLERMKIGLAPLDKDNKPIELHHIGQKNDSPLAELTRTQHMENGNDIILHDKKKESEIDRESFQKERREYWKDRAKQIEQTIDK